MRQAAMFSFFGTVFGFVLSRAGATSFDAIAGMFLLTELHLMGVIGVAIVVAGAGFWWLRRQRSDALAGLKPKPMKPGLVFGSALFGAGWALTGTCPGTGLAQIGEGKWMALFTVAGIFGGSALYRVAGPLLEARLARKRTSTDESRALTRRFAWFDS